MMTEAGDAGAGEMKRGAWNLKVVLLLAGLVVLISASVVATDVMSPRNRQGAPTATTLHPATAATSTMRDKP